MSRLLTVEGGFKSYAGGQLTLGSIVQPYRLASGALIENTNALSAPAPSTSLPAASSVAALIEPGPHNQLILKPYGVGADDSQFRARISARRPVLASESAKSDVVTCAYDIYAEIDVTLGDEDIGFNIKSDTSIVVAKAIGVVENGAGPPSGVSVIGPADGVGGQSIVFDGFGAPLYEVEFSSNGFASQATKFGALWAFV